MPQSLATRRPPARRRRVVHDRVLLRRYAERRDPELRRQLVERYLPLAKKLALGVRGGPEPLDDLIQVACIGLVKALDRYDPDHGAAFTTFAIPTINGELRRHLRDRSWVVRPPRDLLERSVQVQRTIEQLSTGLDHAPTVRDIGERLGLADDEVLEALHAVRGRSLRSLDAPGADGADDLHAVIGERDDGYEAAECRAELARLAGVLTPRERHILRLRFQEDLTQREIGRRVGVSQMHVSRILRGAVAKLREAAEAGSG